MVIIYELIPGIILEFQGILYTKNENFVAFNTFSCFCDYLFALDQTFSLIFSKMGNDIHLCHLFIVSNIRSTNALMWILTIMFRSIFPLGYEVVYYTTS